MKRLQRKSVCILLMFVMLIGLMAPISVKAAVKPSLAQSSLAVSTKDGMFQVEIKGVNNKENVTDIKWTNGKIFEGDVFVLHTDYNDKCYLEGYCSGKTGKSTITFNVKYGSGQTVKLKFNITFYKYKSGYAALKVNGKNYTSKVKKGADLYLSFKKGKKYKVNVKTKTGWKFNRIECYSGETGKTTTLKSGQTFTAAAGASYTVYLYNEKYKCYEMLLLGYGTGS